MSNFSDNQVDYLYSLDLKNLSELIINLKKEIRRLTTLIKNQETIVNDLLFNSDIFSLDDSSENCSYTIEHNKLDSLKREKISLNNYLTKCSKVLDERKNRI